MSGMFQKRWKTTSYRVADGLFIFVRHVLTVLLLWLRIPLMWILSILSTLSFFAWIFILLVTDGSGSHDRAMTWGMFIMSLGSFGLMYLYDSILGFVSPDGLIVDAG